jgi:hypothetical protein
MNKRNTSALVAFILLVVAAVVAIGWKNSASATEPGEPCTEVVTVVDEEAWTETIEHEAVTETTPAVWANWAPNNTQGPQDYVPVWPVDERGTWIVHEQGVPPGHEGPDGVYQQGGGNSPWFYRQAEKVTVIEEAWTEVIEHPAVTHEETVEVPCEEEPKEISADAPTFKDPCGVTSDTFVVPADTDLLDYSWQGTAQNDNYREITVTVELTDAAVEQGYELKGETSWVYAFDDIGCPDPEEPKNPDEPNTPVVNTPDQPAQPKAPSVPTSVDAGL